jgi:HEAT repeat protein
MLLTLRLLIVSALPIVAAAQVAPPKQKPAPRTKTAPSIPKKTEMAEPMSRMEPLLHMEPMGPMRFDFDLHMDPLLFKTHELEWRAKAFAKVDAERIASKVREIEMRSEEFKMRAEEAAQHVAMLDFDRGVKVSPSFDLKFDFNDGFNTKISGDRLLSGKPRASWASEDPADSLYRQAREALNRGEYRRAAQLFGDVTNKFPKSVYAQDCAYWEAFSRYRSGSTDDLKLALKILEGVDVNLMRSNRESSVDVPALRARVQGALAARGDQKAAADLQKELANKESCDREDMSVRAEALSALGQMDPASAMPVVKKVLQKRDECTVELRRRALYVAGRQTDAEAAAVILDVAKNDPDRDLRAEAMRWLPRVAGDNAVPQLEEMLKTSTDESTQRSAVYALSSIDTERARRAVRTLIERTDVSENVRYEAINGFSREREGRSISAEEMNYLRSLYGKLDSPKLRQAVLTSVSRVETPDNAAFMLNIAKAENENTSIRYTAIQRLSRMGNVSATDIAKLYDVADARSLREQILIALSQRKEPEAIDKMMEVAKKDTDPNIRRTAVSLLARSNNERAKQLLKELIDK